MTDIIFDFFGTLVDYSADRNLTVVKTSHEFLRERGFQINQEDYISEFDRCFIELEKEAIKNKTEFHMFDLGKLFFKSCFGYDVKEEENREFIEEYIQNWNIKTIVLDNIELFIRKLSKAYTLHILSNTHYPPLIHENLQAMNIAQYFSHVFTSVEIGTRKPNKEIFLYALNEMKRSPDTTVFVGDNYTDDFCGGLSVGLQCYLVDQNGEHEALGDRRLHHLFDLPDRLV